MHGLVNRAIQCFLRDTYGPELWAGVASDIGVGTEGFEAMLASEDGVTRRLFAAAARRLRRPAGIILEDIGLYLVSRDPVRRLLRFGGADYAEFLFSLTELAERSALAVPGLDLPEIEVSQTAPASFALRLGGHRAYGPVLAGLLRAMADDYGALALIDRREAGPRARPEAGSLLDVTLLDAAHAEGRGFRLARPGLH